MKGRSLSASFIQRIALSVTISVEKPRTRSPKLRSPGQGSVQFIKSRVSVLALVMEHGIEVETLRLRFQMPFTDQSGLIASRPHLLGDIILLRIKRIT